MKIYFVTKNTSPSCGSDPKYIKAVRSTEDGAMRFVSSMSGNWIKYEKTLDRADPPVVPGATVVRYFGSDGWWVQIETLALTED